ncbi:PAS domain S-box protein [Undibacterium sp. Jales W-56]|uniref:PAS domain S-box protein n=1 Tax=Undibacterium sp. Jales W-56 TaxID=2897325 RepID=UPI0021D1A4EB|nr:PAS domain S-box protein [Undibacterium sp. Jales W-56]MCU6435728.1 PAS domain S-box protein [Undibacterium sp. Jales W-56]
MPSFFLPVAIVWAIGISFITMLVLFYLRCAKVSTRASQFWTIAYACMALRQLCVLFDIDKIPLSAMGVDFFSLGFVCFFWCGTRIFLDKLTAIPRITLYFSLLFFWTFVSHLTNFDYLLRELPVYLFAGSVLGASAINFWKASRTDSRSGYQILALLIGLRGLSLFDFLLIRSNENLLPWGFMLSSLLDLSIGMQLLVAIILEQRKQGEILSASIQEEMTVRKQAEGILREREALFEKVFQFVPDVLVICREKDGRYVEVNQHWEALTGYSREESLGKYSLELNLWADTSQRDRLLEAMRVQGEVHDLQATYRHKLGHHYFVNISGVRFEVGGESFLMYLVEDRTELRRIENQRREALMQLQEREKRFVKIFDLVPEAISIIRMDNGILVDVNTNWLSMFGLVREQAIGKHPSRDLNLWLDNQHRTQFVNQLLRLEQGDSVRGEEIRFRGKDGVSILAEAFCTVFESDNQKYLLTAMRDITEIRESEQARKRAESNLREREAVLATVFQLVPDTLTITRMADGHYIDVNRNWEPLSGYRREEAVGHTSGDLNLWASVAQRQEMVDLIQRDGEVRGMQIAFRHKDGHIFQCRVSGSKFVTGDETYLLLASHNIDQEIAAESARAKAEMLLRENEYKYSTIFQLSPIALGLVNVASSLLIEVNDVWLTLFGYQRDQVLGRTALELQFWEKPEQRDEMMRQLFNEGRVDRFEIRHRHQNGQTLICLLSARLFTMNGEKVFIFGFHDVTRQYQIEQEIREMTVQLEARVRLRTIKLEQANIELAEAMESLKRTQDELIRSEKMAALGSLVAGVAHELNTPIGNSVTVASTLQDKTKELLKDIGEGKLRRSTLDSYLQSASTGTALLMRTLGIARELVKSFKQVAVDQSSNQRRQFDLKSALEEVIATLTPMFHKGAFSLKTDLIGDVAMDSFPGPLGQIITNFMTNALNHAFDDKESGEMRISSRLRDEAHVEIIFADDGKGIADVDQKRVFDPFFTTKLGQGGSGLGMHIAYNLVTGVLGGSIDLESHIGKGTKFTMVLPLVAPEISSEIEPYRADT